MLEIRSLFCEHQKNPYGIEEQHPRFSWILESSRENVTQAEYQICVWKENTMVWDSGRKKSSQSIEIIYEGMALEPLCRYRWEVAVRDDAGECAKAQAAFYTARMGIPWKASWVEPDQQPTKKTETDPVKMTENTTADREMDGFGDFQPVKYLRIPFRVKSGLKSAVVCATSHGVYALDVNGEPADERLFAPEITSYQAILQYQMYDVYSKLTEGKNVFAVRLGDGWWSGRVGMSGDSCQYGDTVGLLLEAVLEYEDGTKQYVCSQDAVSETGPIVFSDLFVGEMYDARLERPGWNLPEYDDSSWNPVKKANFGMENIMAQYGEPVRVIRQFRPQEILHTPAGEIVVDLGQNIAGFLEIQVDAPAGTVIKMEFSEMLDEHGNFFQNIMGTNKDQTDYYIAGEGQKNYRPLFTYYGFRYVRLKGWPGIPDTDKFMACVVSSDCEEIGMFETSDDRINRLQENIWWSQTANMVSIPTDCPQREKAGWTGDIMVYAPTMCFNRESDIFLRRWLRNCRAEQLADGAIPTVVPYLQSYREMNKFMGTDTSCGWGDAILAVPWALYQAYGDRGVLEENYESMKRWLGYIQHCAETEMINGYEQMDEAAKQRQRYLWNTGFHYGDWLVPSMVLNNANADAMISTAYATKDIVAPAYYGFAAKLMGDIAQVLGKNEDADFYKKLHENIREAFQAEYVKADGRIQTDLQGIYVIALKHNLITEELRPKVVKQLRRCIEENNGCLDTGFLSVPFLMDVLTDNGCEDLARKILFQEECPSWLYEVKKGATTMWESWGAIMPDGRVSNYSYNHYAFGCVGDWMYRRLAGIEALEPGYRRVRVAPMYNCGLAEVRASLRTPYGQLRIHWRIEKEQIELSLTIPANTRAVVILPDRSEREFGSGKKKIMDFGAMNG